MKLAVFGATGGIGGQLVRLALEQGNTVTAIVRDEARFTGERHPALHVVTVPDLADTDRLQAAVSGCDAAVSGVGARTRKDVNVASTATRGIIAALEAAGVGRLVVVSAAPVGPLSPADSWLDRRVLTPVIRRILAETYADLAVMEADLAASGLKWTVVRPPRLTDKPLGEYRTVFGANVPRGHFAARAEVAHAMLALLTDDRAVRTAVGVAR